MLEITADKIAYVIIRAREYESGVNAWAHSGHRTGHGVRTELHEFIASLNDDEQAALTAVMWIGRESFDAEDLDEAVAWAKRCPNPMPGPSELEIRPLYELEDFQDVLTPEAAETHARNLRNLADGD